MTRVQEDQFCKMDVQIAFCVAQGRGVNAERCRATSKIRDCMQAQERAAINECFYYEIPTKCYTILQSYCNKQKDNTGVVERRKLRMLFFVVRTSIQRQCTNSNQNQSIFQFRLKYKLKSDIYYMINSIQCIEFTIKLIIRKLVKGST